MEARLMVGGQNDNLFMNFGLIQLIRVYLIIYNKKIESEIMMI